MNIIYILEFFLYQYNLCVLYRRRNVNNKNIVLFYVLKGKRRYCCFKY